MKNFNRTYLMGILALAFAAWVAWQTGKISMKLVSNEPGPRFFPYISAAGIAIFAILSMIFDAPKEKKQAEATGKPMQYLDKAGWKRMAIIFGESIAFTICMEFIGFWITAMVFMMVFIYTLKGEKKVNTIFAVCLSIGLASLCYFGFTRGFHIPLPVGKLWELLDIPMP